mgnify:CR=1 FL=1
MLSFNDLSNISKMISQHNCAMILKVKAPEFYSIIMKHIVTIFLLSASFTVKTISCCKAHKNMPAWTRLALVAVGANPNYGDSVRKYLISKLYL